MHLKSYMQQITKSLLLHLTQSVLVDLVPYNFYVYVMI